MLIIPHSGAENNKGRCGCTYVHEFDESLKENPLPDQQQPSDHFCPALLHILTFARKSLSVFRLPRKRAYTATWKLDTMSTGLVPGRSESW